MRTNMRTIGVISVMVLALGFWMAGSARAMDITVGDPSFEEATIANNDWVYINYNVPPWICSSGTTSGAWTARNYSSGVSYGYPQTGHNSLTYTEFNNWHVYQTLAATYKDGYEYTLSCWSTNHLNTSGTITLSLTDGVNFADENLAIGSSGPQTIPIQSGIIWHEYTYTYIAKPEDDGKTIGIQFQGGPDTNFDDVTLEENKSILTVKPIRLDIAEEGPTSDTYDITLLKDPNDGVAEGNPGQVVVTVTPDAQSNVGAGGGNPISLTFTVKDVPQTVTVTAVDDTDIEGNHPSTITNLFTSADLSFNGITREVIANITDNDVPGVTLTEPNGTLVDEAGTIIESYTIVPDSKMQADDNPADPDPNDVNIIVEPNQFEGTPQADVQISITSGSGYTTGTITLTFTKDNWATAQTIYVKGVQDTYVEPFDVQVIRHTVVDNGTSYDASVFTAGVPDVNAYIADDDGPVLALNEGIRLLLDYEDAQLGLDTSGSGANGRPFGDPTAAGGKVGSGAVALDDDDYLNCSDPNVLRPTKAVTVSVWANANTFDAYGGVVYNAFWTSTNQNGFMISTQSSGAYQWWLKTDTGGYGELNSGPALTGQWYHLVGTYDSDTSTFAFYVNGVPMGFVILSGDIKWSTQPLYGLLIGVYYDDNEYHPYDGLVDQVALWDRALGITEVIALYNAGNGTTLSGKEGIIIRESDGKTDVTENSVGADDSYTVELTTTPSATVTVTLEPAAGLDVGNGDGVAKDLSFSAAAAPQTVTVVSTVDDAALTIGEIAKIYHKATSSDADYQRLSPAYGDVQVEIMQNECGAWNYSTMDFDKNCYVDLKDYAAFAAQWLGCTEPDNPLCDDES